MIICKEDLSEEALVGLIDNHITGGCDQYKGSLKNDRQKVLGGLNAGTLKILFSENEGSVRIISWDASENRPNQ